MTNLARLWRPSTVGTLTLVGALIVAPLPAEAGNITTSATPAPGIATSIRTVAATEALVSGQPAAAQQAQAGAGDLGSPNFFKTPAGIVTLLAIGVGVGFALYSTSHDRVKSPAR